MSETSSQAERLADGGERYGACDEQVKLERAQGGMPCIRSRRRT